MNHAIVKHTALHIPVSPPAPPTSILMVPLGPMGGVKNQGITLLQARKQHSKPHPFHAAQYPHTEQGDILDLSRTEFPQPPASPAQHPPRLVFITSYSPLAALMFMN